MNWNGRYTCVTSLLVDIYVLGLLLLLLYQSATSVKMLQVGGFLHQNKVDVYLFLLFRIDLLDVHLQPSFIVRLTGVPFACNATWLFMLVVKELTDGIFY